MKKQVSPGAAALIVVVILVVLGLVFWSRSRPQSASMADGTAGSTAPASKLPHGVP